MSAPSRHPSKKIVKIADGHWTVSCRRCGGKRTKQHRGTAAECNEWYVEHSRTEYHRKFRKRAEDEEIEVLLRLIRGDEQKG